MLSYVCEGAITIVSIEDIYRAGDEDVEVTVVIYINECSGSVRPPFRRRHFDARSFRAIRKVAIPIIVIKNKSIVGEARDEQIRLAVVIVIPRDCGQTIGIASNR